jgi:urease beta subunit
MASPDEIVLKKTRVDRSCAVQQTGAKYVSFGVRLHLEQTDMNLPFLLVPTGPGVFNRVHC